MRTFSGIVQKGKSQGAKLGYPTANIELAEATIPGIYVASVAVGESTYKAAAFIDTDRRTLEVHLLDFSGDLYGKKIDVQLLKKIRDSQHFESDETLKIAIAEDVQEVQRYFSEKRNPSACACTHADRSDTQGSPHDKATPPTEVSP